MFRRSKSESADVVVAEPVVTAGRTTAPKGRPTPSRKEAEAAAKARAKVPRSRKEQVAAQRLAKSESSAQVRSAMKAGDERYLLGRDKGPVRRFCRDYVDTRFSILELAIPILVVGLVLGYAQQAGASESIMFATLLVMIVEAVRLRSAIRKEVRTRFPDAPLRGLTYYTVSRATQLRFMRMPKARLKRGETLTARYDR